MNVGSSRAWAKAALWLLAATLTSGCDAPPPRRARPPRAESRPTPSERPVVDGTAPIEGHALLRQLKQPGRKGALLNVWASWCGSCKREIPMLMTLREAFEPQGVDVQFVSADTPPSWADAVTFGKQAGLPIPLFVVSGSLGPFKRALSPRWRGAIPATFLFDAEGTLRHRWEGQMLEHELTPVVQAFLAGENVDGETLPPVSGGPAQ